MKPCQVDWQKLVITEILFSYREIELINIIKQIEKPTFIYVYTNFLTPKYHIYIDHIVVDLLCITYKQSTTLYGNCTTNIMASKCKMPRKKGNQTGFSSQKATQMVFMDTLS